MSRARKLPGSIVEDRLGPIDVQTASLVELFDREAERKRLADEVLRTIAAEVAVLERYDARRSALGHDYGGGQRYRELEAARRMLAEAEALAEREHLSPRTRPPMTRDELVAAAERILGPKLRRVEREDYRRSTPATSRTLRALTSTLSLYTDRPQEGTR